MCEYCELDEKGLTRCLDSAGWEYLEECEARIVENFLRFSMRACLFYGEVRLYFDFKINCCPICGRLLPGRKPVDGESCDYHKAAKNFFGVSAEGLGIRTYYPKMPNTRYLNDVEAYYDGEHLCLWLEEEMFNKYIQAEFKFDIKHCPQCGEELGEGSHEIHSNT